MPDKNLQKAVAEQYHVTVTELTKELLENESEAFIDLKLTDDYDSANNDDRYLVTNLEGLQYISGTLQANVSLY
ncbi:hypothetical protein CON87_34320, partial [Bacillus cereus]